MGDMFPGMFISSFATSVEDFFSDAWDFASDKGSDLITKATSTVTDKFSDPSALLSGAAQFVNGSARDRRAAANKREMPGEAGVGHGQYPASRSTPMASVDPKAMHREWVSRLSTFSDVQSATYVKTPKGGKDLTVRGDG